MNQHLPGNKTIVTVHGYQGDRHQMEILRGVHEHHQLPIVYMSPEDSQVHLMGPHICRCAGKRAYIGQLSLDRQYEHFKMMLDYDSEWYLAHDADSFVLTPELPAYLYEDKEIFWSNEVDDFRKPGQVYTDASGSIRWPDDYHSGYPLLAFQPPYFASRHVIERIVKRGRVVACPTTPFIDYATVQWVVDCGLKHQRFPTGASCETVTENGRLVMEECITKRGATFLHSIKSQEALGRCLNAFKKHG